jgi:prepilin-type N-terminal cleavage/methylation domain-containing protein
MAYSLQYRKGVTFVEMIIVLSIITILFATFFYIWNSLDIFRKSRDSKRINDLQLLDSDLKTIISTESNISLGQENIIYTSLPDSSSTCGSYNLIPVFSPYSYKCQTSQNYLKVDGTGWLPVNLTLGKILTISVLPVDPLNNKDYFYAYQVRNNRYKLTARLEAPVNISKMVNDGGIEPTLYEVGSDLFMPSPHSGLVGYWSFDEGTGTIAYDLSGYGNNGTLVNGTTWVDGKIGKALSFDGSDDYLVADNIKVNTTQGAQNTVIFWMNWSGQNTVMPFGWNTSYDLFLYSNAFGFNTGCSNIEGFSGTSFLQNSWHNVAAVFYNGTPSFPNVKLYIDGDGKSVTHQFGTICSGTVTNRIFVSGWGVNSGYKFNGLIDEVRVYNRALSDSEIKALYDATK